MATKRSTFALLTTIVVVLAAVVLVAVTRSRMSNSAPPAAATSPQHAPVAFNPPRPEDAPPELRDAVMYGYEILMDTRRYARDHVGNNLRCTNCHFDAGRSQQGISLVGVAAIYPKYRERTRYATDLVSRTNECFERSLNGSALDPNGKEMQAIIAYYQWISRGVPIYAPVPWLGVKKLKVNHQPDAMRGSKVYVLHCARCHGVQGNGTAEGPPLWGPHSFNDGAGLAQLEMLAGFAYANMPKAYPDLKPEEALDVAAYVTGQPRPRFGRQNP